MKPKPLRQWKISDLSPEYQNTYFNCLEDWSDEIRDAGNHKACWYDKFKDKGLGVKIALNDKNEVAGMIQYLPIEQSFVEGKDIYVILCIWVHGHKQGIGNYQGKGIGEALLTAAEGDAKSKGAKGMAAWGLWTPFWMKASWFKKHGYRKADREGFGLLVWKPFHNQVQPPSWIRQKKTPPLVPGKVIVAAYINGWCPGQNITFERAKRVCSEFGDKVIFQQFETANREIFLEWGITDAVYVNGKPVSYGPPASDEKIRKMISKEIRKIAH